MERADQAPIHDSDPPQVQSNPASMAGVSVARPGRVADKVALVTGAASGFGEAIASLLAREGAAVIVADIDDRRGSEAAARIISQGGEATYLHLDVADEAAWVSAMETTLRLYGRLHILVNNAGIAPSGSMTMDFELWRQVMRINLDGTFLGTRHAIEAASSTSPP